MTSGRLGIELRDAGRTSWSAYARVESGVAHLAQRSAYAPGCRGYATAVAVTIGERHLRPGYTNIALRYLVLTNRDCASHGVALLLGLGT